MLKKSTWKILHAYIDANSQRSIDEYPGDGVQNISRLKYQCASMTFDYQSRYKILRGLFGKLSACASASSAQNSQYAQLTHSSTIENRVSDLRRHAHFNIELRVSILGHLHPAVDRE